MADQVLDSISGLGPQWEAAIRRLKFEVHNREWMEAVQVRHPRSIFGKLELRR